MQKIKRDIIKKVLIALDFDPTAQKVAETGFSLAKTIGAEVTLLHVISDPLHYSAYKHITVMGFAGYDNTAPLILGSEEELKKESLKFLKKSKEHLGDSSIKTTVKEGDVADCILDTAKKLHADIIIIGSHSRKWLENIVMGSVAEKVLRNSVLPLFFIPTKKQD
jgi:nucleotide-binding universal stress UspA family protein